MKIRNILNHKILTYCKLLYHPSDYVNKRVDEFLVMCNSQTILKIYKSFS